MVGEGENISVVVKTVNYINFLAGLLTTKAVRYMLEAELLHSNYGKSSARLLQRKPSVPNACMT
jgi:hypothetical protein